MLGNFATTSLDYSTITINGSAGNDTVDITGLTSDHRVVFVSNGGNDTVLGTPRPQDVFGMSERLNALTDMIGRAAGSQPFRGSGYSLLELTCGPLPWPHA